MPWPLIMSQLTRVRHSNLRPRRGSFSFCSNPSLSTRSTKAVSTANVENQICLQSARQRYVDGLTQSLFSCTCPCVVCVCVCMYRTCMVHRALLRANTATRETPIRAYKRKNMKVHGNTQRQECALRLPVGLFTYISIKRRGVISSSGAAGRYKSWKWSL